MAKKKVRVVYSTMATAKAAIKKKYGDVIKPMSEQAKLEIKTISTGTLSLDAALGRGGMAIGRVYEVYGPPSGGKCCTENTYLFTEYGLLTIKELFELKGTPTFIIDKEIKCACGLLNEHGEMENTSHFVWNGKKPVRKIITKAGFEAESTYNHKYRVIDPDTGFIVWKKTKDISTDDYLLLNRYNNNDIKQDEINEDEATFLGMLVAEGCISQKNTVSFSNIDVDMIYLFSNLSSKIFNYSDVKHRTKDGHRTTVDNGAVESRINSKEIRDKLYSDYGMDYVVANGKTVPLKVRMSSNKIVKKFLSAYFSLDGCYERSNRITACSASIDLMRQIQLLLLSRFNIRSSMKSKFNKKYNKFYYYIDISCDDAYKFIKEIGFILKDKLDKINDVGCRADTSSMKWNFPYQNNLIKALCKDVEGNRLSDSIINKYISDDRNQKLSQNKISEILNYFPKLFPGDTAKFIIRHFKKLQDYICDQVDTVVDIGEKPVFDVVMPETRSFISNGLISHNTTLAMSVITQAQKRGMQCVFVDAEHSADPKLFKNMGVDLENLLTIKAFAGDDNLDALETLMKTTEIDVAVVDSVSALIPKAESEASIGDEFMGLLARLMSKALRKLSPVASETNTLLIFVNQIRFKIGGYGDPTITTGGQALDFYATGRIAVSGGEYKNSRITDVITDEVIGHKTNFHVRKNKLAPPFRNATVPLIYGKGYDVHWEVLTLSEQLGLIEKSGAWYKYDDKNFAQGEISAKDYLKENEDLYNTLREKIIDTLDLRTYYNEQTSR